MAEAIYCYEFFAVLLLWWELTLQAMLIAAAVALDHYIMYGITPDGCCGAYDDTVVIYDPYPPLMYSPYPPAVVVYEPYMPGPPVYYPAPPYQSVSQYDAHQRGQLPIIQNTQSNDSQGPSGTSQRPPLQQSQPQRFRQFPIPQRPPLQLTPQERPPQQPPPSSQQGTSSQQ